MMEIAILQENLKRALDILGGVWSEGYAPWSYNVKIEANERVCLSAANRTVAIHCNVGAKVALEGSMVVPAKSLRALVKELPRDRLDMTSGSGYGDDEQCMDLLFKVGRSEHTLKGWTSATFVDLAFPTEQVLALDVSLFSRAVKRCLIAADTRGKGGRPYLEGMVLEGKDGRFRMIAADGHRMSVQELGLYDGPDAAWLFPARALANVPQLGRWDEDDQVEMYADSIRVGLVFGANVRFSVQLLDLVTPDYQAITPPASAIQTSFTVDTDEMQRALKSMNVFARTAGLVCRVTVIPRERRVILSAKSDQEGDVKEELTINPEHITGEELTVMVNVTFLRDGVSVMDTPLTTFEFTDDKRPLLMRPYQEDDFYYLVMPMQSAR